MIKIALGPEKKARLLKIKSYETFKKDGADLLGLTLSPGTHLETIDGIIVDCDDGLQYAVQANVTVLFKNSDHQSIESEQPKTDASDLTSVSDAGRTQQKPWPLNYVLPQVYSSVESQLARAKNKEDAAILLASANFCNRFLQPIIEDIEQYTDQGSYLSCQQFQDIGKAIKIKYPMLTDEDGGWQYLKYKLINKLKYLRRRIKTPCDKVLNMRTKYASRKRVRQEDILPNGSELVDLLSKRQKIRSEEAHIEESEPIHSASLTSKEDLTRTFQHRKQAAQSQTVAEEMELCPALKQYDLLLHEALLVLKEYVKSPRSDYYLPPNLTVEEMVQMTESVLRKASSIYSHKEREDGENRLLDGFMSITKKLREKAANFFETGKAAVVIGGSPEAPEAYIKVNGLKVGCHGGFRVTVLCFVLAHIAFNIEHGPKQEASLEFLEAAITIRKTFTKLSSKQLAQILLAHK